MLKNISQQAVFTKDMMPEEGFISNMESQMQSIWMGEVLVSIPMNPGFIIGRLVIIEMECSLILQIKVVKDMN